MTEDIRSYVQTCQKCQRMNPKFQKSQSSLHPVQVQPKVWSQVSEGSTCSARVLCPRMNASNLFLVNQVGIDLIGPLPTTARGNKYIVTLVDYFSRWPEAAGLPDKTAFGVAMFLYELFCR